MVISFLFHRVLYKKLAVIVERINKKLHLLNVCTKETLLWYPDM